MMGWVEGMLSGFTQAKVAREVENLRQAELANAREAKVYESLAASSDPEIRSMAITGLLDSARPGRRRAGFRGWLGEMESHPMLSQIKTLIATPETVDEDVVTPGLPSRQTSGYIGLPPGAQPAALPASSAVTPDSVPLAAVQSPIGTPPPPTIESRAITRDVAGPSVGRIDTRTITRPRQVFRTPEEDTLRTRRAQAQGDIQGEVAGLAEAFVQSGMEPAAAQAKAADLVAQERTRRAVGTTPFQAIAGTLPDGSPISAVFDRSSGKYRHPVTGDVLEGFVARASGGAGSTYAEGEITADPDSPTGFSQTLYLRADPSIRQRIPASAPTARSSRAVNTSEQVAFDLFGKPGEDPRAVLSRLTPEQMGAVLQKKQQLDAQTAGGITTARGAAAADAPLTTQQRFQATTDLQAAWRKAEAPRREMERQLQLMQTGLQRFRAGDKIGGSQAVLVTFQKILDPTSVVRESEYARSPEGLSLWGRIEGYLDRLRQGGAGVPDTELAAMVETAQQFLQGVAGWNATEHQRLDETARDFGIDPARIFGGRSTVGQPPPSGATAAPRGATGAAIGTPPPSASPAGVSGYRVGDPVEYQGQQLYVVGFENGQLVLSDQPPAR